MADDENTQSFIVLTADTAVNQYRIVNRIGAGGMGEVYLADDTKLNRKVALKFLSSHLCQDENCRTRFIREAQAAAKLDHPNIVPVYEVGDFQNRPYIVMAHIEGKSLTNVIKEGDLSISEILAITGQICEGLQEAHNAGIVHRDIKPENVIIDQSDRARILDFGLATIIGEEELTKTGTTLGTVGYMAPEQIKGRRVDKRADLFSTGVILYEMLTRNRPFKGDNYAAVAMAITESNPEPVARFKSGTSEEVQRIVDKALAKDPSLRYQTAGGMLADIKRLGAAPKYKTKRGLIGIGIGIVIAVIAGAYLMSTVVENQVEKTTALSEPPVLIVLPFDNLGDPSDEYFSVGIREEINSRLSAVSGLRVLSPRSADKYENSDESIDRIGRETGAEYVLDATIRWDKSGKVSRFRITPKLVKTSNGYMVWSDNFELELVRVFDVQAMIADRIVTALGLSLLDTEHHAPDYAPTSDMQAYNYYLRGLDIMSEGIYKANLHAAVHKFDSATILDPQFAQAWAKKSIALTEYEFGRPATVETSSNTQHALEAAEKALTLAPSLPDGHIALGSYYNYFSCDYEKALNEFVKAESEINSNADLSEEIGVVKMRQGEWSTALEYFREAARLDPLTVRRYYWLFMYYAMVRDYDNAERNVERGLALAPDDPDMAYWRILLNLLRDGSVDSRNRSFEEIVERVGAAHVASYEMFPSSAPGLWRYVIDRVDPNRMIEDLREGEDESVLYRVYMNIGQIYDLTGRNDLADIYYDSCKVTLERQIQYSTSDFNTYSSLGLAYAFLGKADSAIWAGKKGKEMMSVDLCHL